MDTVKYLVENITSSNFIDTRRSIQALNEKLVDQVLDPLKTRKSNPGCSLMKANIEVKSLLRSSIPAKNRLNEDLAELELSRPPALANSKLIAARGRMGDKSHDQDTSFNSF